MKRTVPVLDPQLKMFPSAIQALLRGLSFSKIMQNHNISILYMLPNIAVKTTRSVIHRLGKGASSIVKKITHSAVTYFLFVAIIAIYWDVSRVKKLCSYISFLHAVLYRVTRESIKNIEDWMQATTHLFKELFLLSCFL